MSDATTPTGSVSVHVDIPETANVPSSILAALEKVAAAAADEEITLSAEIADALHAESEVSGFASGTSMGLGDLSAGSFSSPTTMSWCIARNSSGEHSGGSCGVYARDTGNRDQPAHSCGAYWLK